MNYHKPDGLDNRDLYFHSSSCLKSSVGLSKGADPPTLDPTLLSRAHAEVYNLRDGEADRRVFGTHGTANLVYWVQF